VTDEPDKPRALRLEKTVKLDESIGDQVADKIARFHAQFGREPIAILLGPNEWLALGEWVACRMYNGHFQPMTDAAMQFLGLPVLPKQTGGIELAVPPSVVFHLAKGVVKQLD
jgi:hypothetical protein